MLKLLGEGGQQIFEALSGDGQTFERAMTRLNNNFKSNNRSAKSFLYQRSIFHQSNRQQGESRNLFIIELRKLTKFCELDRRLMIKSEIK